MNQGGYGDGGEYYNPYGGGYGDGTNTQQYDGAGNPYQQGQYYEEGSNQQYQEGYYEQGNEYYSEQQQGYEDSNQYGEYGAGEGTMAADPNAPFHPSRPPFVAHPNGRADDYGNYDAIGDPISAVAIDDGDSSSDVPGLMYVASHTSKQGSGRSSGRGGRGSVGSSRLTDKDPSLSRGSRMTVLYDINDAKTEASGGGFYGNRSMYASFVAHPEAEGRILDGLHSALLGGGISINIGSGASSHTVKARPTHAYGPSYGPPSWAHRIHLNANPHFPQQQNTNRPEERHCKGISSIFPVTTPYLGSGGRVCTISPHGVRIHTRGGMVMSNRSDGFLSGMTCGELLGGGRGGSQFATICGMSFPSGNSDASSRSQHVHCVDLNKDLKVVSSHTLARDSASNNGSMCVADLATNVERNNVVVGCTDGTIRVLDGGRRNAEVAKAKAQLGGVAKVAVSENLIVASGYSSAGVSSPSSPLPYPFPAPHVLIYDVRYLGRGGIPHMFSANRGGARFVNFLPDVDNTGTSNLLVGSGQSFGSFEIITPFSNDGVNSSTFWQPELNSSESMTVVDVQDGELIIGTSHGRVLQYGLAGYDKTVHSAREQSASSTGSRMGSASTDSFGGSGAGAASSPKQSKEPLDMPPFAPAPPAFSIDPSVLCSPPQQHSSTDPLMPGWNVFDSYAMSGAPLLSSDRALFPPRYSRAGVKSTTLAPMSNRPMVAPSRRWLSKELQDKLDKEDIASTGGSGNMKVFAATSLEMKDLLGSPTYDEEGTNGSLPNPNKLLYSPGPFAACYDATAISRRKVQDSSGRRQADMGEEDWADDEENGIPRRYRLTLRPTFPSKSFDYAQYNQTGLWPGWDYPPSYSNSSQCAVLAMLYFVGEIREAALRLQLSKNGLSLMTEKASRRDMNVSIVSELGLLFHQIESLSANAMVHLRSEHAMSKRGQVKAFVPANCISAFALLPEAKNLALVDGVPGATEIARRPEAFYRFLMQYVEREFGQVVASTLGSLDTTSHLIDRLQGVNFLSVIEYSQGKPKISTSRGLMIDLSYNPKLSGSNVRFGEILRYSLCKEAPLRAWCEETRSYEAVVQRKIATSLPSMLSLSCCCAGRRVDTAGLQFWQREDATSWLPERIEIQIETDRSITVKELVTNDDGKGEWMTFEERLPLSESFFEGHKEVWPQSLPIKKSYRLDAVVSFIRTSSPDQISCDTSSSIAEGHHVVHVRAPTDLKRKLLTKQLQQIERCISGEDESSPSEQHTTLVSDIQLPERRYVVKKELAKLDGEDTGTDWLLLNGFVVTPSTADDVRSFNAKFKEPSIVLYREVSESDSGKEAASIDPSKDLSAAAFRAPKIVSPSIMGTESISNHGAAPKLSISGLQKLPLKGRLVAIDAEFVCVQAEESVITASGSKKILSEPRNALARLSVIDCQTNEVLLDDYVLPNEPVVDHLTRFSGIQERDLDASHSPHHLVTPQEAYLKMRLLMERGCIFVGHGLSQDFRMIGICVPPNQVIDTAEIYHQPNQRYISLRYLANYVLERDMQQDVHDSIEDAKAASELYDKAASLKKKGEFDDYLMKLYAHGHTTQFKLGVAQKKSETQK